VSLCIRRKGIDLVMKTSISFWQICVGHPLSFDDSGLSQVNITRCNTQDISVEIAQIRVYCLGMIYDSICCVFVLFLSPVEDWHFSSAGLASLLSVTRAASCEALSRPTCSSHQRGAGVPCPARIHATHHVQVSAQLSKVNAHTVWVDPQNKCTFIRCMHASLTVSVIIDFFFFFFWVSLSFFFPFSAFKSVCVYSKRTEGFAALIPNWNTFFLSDIY